MKRTLKVVGIIIAVLIVLVIALPFFFDANMFRPKLESELTNSLGRQVKVGNLTLSLFSGGVTADQISIADDPAFSKSPFVQAKSLKVGVEMIPLIFSKTLNVTNLTLDQPEINLVKSEDGEKWNFSSLGTKGGAEPASATPATSNSATESRKTPAEEKSGAAHKTANEGGNGAQQPQRVEGRSSSENPNLSVAKFSVTNGRVSVSQAGGKTPTRVYDKVTITMTDFSFASSFPFKLSADLPGGGTLTLDGKAGPIDENDAAATPLDAKINIKNMKIQDSGFIDPASGISGTADFTGNITSDGHEAKTNGTLTATGLKVVAKGSPAGRPVQLTYAVNYNLKSESGTISEGNVAMGKAVAHLTGTYNAHGKVTTVNLKLIGQNMPVDDLEAMLPALGIVLPPNATLKGGDMNTDLTIEGPVDKLVTTGTVRMQNSQLANFNLGSKLSAISALAGKNTGNDTSIQNFSSDIRVAPEGTTAKNINLTVPAIGVLTGEGTVSPTNALAFKMDADVAGLKVPVGITGTTSDPKFTPDVKGLATGMLQNALSGKGLPTGQQGQNPLSGLTGLFKKKK